MGARAIHLPFSCVDTEGLSATADNLRILCVLPGWTAMCLSLCLENVNHEDGPKKRALG